MNNHAKKKKIKSKLPFILRLVRHVRRIIPQKLIEAIYHCSFLSRFIRKQLNLFAPSGLTEVVIDSGVLRGMALSLDLKNEKYYWLGTYENEVIEVIDDFVRHGMVVYDVGANIGYMSLVFARAVGSGGRVFAFEPLPDNVERIRLHITLNSLKDVITLIPDAVSDHAGRQMFLIHELNAMGKLSDSSGRDTAYRNEIEVNTLCLDDFVFIDGNPAPGLIKIDIEGGGVKAIPGMIRILRENQPIILMELHGPEEAKIAWNSLEKCGYKICRIKKGYPVISTLTDLDWKEYIVATVSCENETP